MNSQLKTRKQRNFKIQNSKIAGDAENNSKLKTQKCAHGAQLKIQNSKIAGVAENNSKIKIQNSKLRIAHNSRLKIE